VAVRGLDEALVLHTMRFAEELVEVKSLDLSAPSRKPTRREVGMAATLVESLHDDFAPEALEDDYRQRVLELIEASLGTSGTGATRKGTRSTGKRTGSRPRKRASKANS
jgi:DNA end-binding protein Ku